MSHLQLSPPHPFRWIIDGHGDTFNFRQPAPLDYTSQDLGQNFEDRTAILRIGTYRCCTCVAIYYKIDDHCCCMAHMDAIVDRPATAPDDRLISYPGSHELSASVTDALCKEAAEQGWSPQAGHKAVACCPQLLYKGRSLTGEYVLRGIEAFLGDANLEFRPDIEGFMVHQETRMEVKEFEWNEGAGLMLLERAREDLYQAYEEECDMWRFPVTRSVVGSEVVEGEGSSTDEAAGVDFT